jgi:hypothetical protein
VVDKLPKLLSEAEALDLNGHLLEGNDAFKDLIVGNLRAYIEELKAWPPSCSPPASGWRTGCRIGLRFQRPRTRASHNAGPGLGPSIRSPQPRPLAGLFVAELCEREGAGTDRASPSLPQGGVTKGVT